MTNLQKCLFHYILVINILCEGTFGGYTMDSVDGTLNITLQLSVNQYYHRLVIYKYTTCQINFLHLRIESKMEGNEFVSVKSSSDLYELQLKNMHNLNNVVANVIICSPSSLKRCYSRGNIVQESTQIELRSNAKRDLLVNLYGYLKDFTINIGDKSRDVTIDEYSPVYYLLKFNDTNEDMEVKISSDDNYCMHAFIEKAECSANILTPNLESERVKTITKKGTILIKNRAEYINNSLFLAFKLNDSCDHEVNTINKKTFKTKKFSISFQHIDTNYISRFYPIWIMFLIYCPAGIIYTSLFCIIWSSEETKFKKNITDKSEIGRKSVNGCVPCSRSGYLKCWSYEYFLPSKYICIISIFYILPTVQLLFHYVNVMNLNGNFDFCYYNDQCSKPLGIFLAFNNFISNIGYIFMGIFFIVIVCIRHNCIFFDNNMSCKRSFNSINYGIFYSLGLSLIMEGVISAIYHICPKSNTIQFDSTFMYIIGCLLNLYYAVQLMTLFESYPTDNITTVNSKYNIIDFNTSKNTLAIMSKKYTGKENSKKLDITIFSENNTETGNSHDNLDNNTSIIIAENEMKTINSKNYDMTIISSENKVTINVKGNIGTNQSNNNIGTNQSNNNIGTSQSNNNIGTNQSNNNIGTTNNDKNTGKSNDYDNTDSNFENKNADATNEVNITDINNINSTEAKNEDNIGIINKDNINGDISENNKTVANNDNIENTNNKKMNTVIIDLIDYNLTSDSKYNTRTMISEDNTITVNSKNNNLTVLPKKNSSLVTTCNFIPGNNGEIMRSNDNTITINSKSDFVTINLEDNVAKMDSTYTNLTKYHNIKIKEMFIYMSIVMLVIILIMIFADNWWGVWVVIGIFQSVVVAIYFYRIFFFCKCGIAFSKEFRSCCISIIIAVNIIVFFIGFFCLQFYFYFLVAILTNCFTLAAEYYIIIFLYMDREKKCDSKKSKCCDSKKSKCFDSIKMFLTKSKIHFIILNLIFAAVFTVFAIISFYKAPTEWNKIPSHSREINQECIWWNFYDIHDKWHFLSSIAIFLIYMLIFLMDNLINEKKMETEKLNEGEMENENKIKEGVMEMKNKTKCETENENMKNERKKADEDGINERKWKIKNKIIKIISLILFFICGILFIVYLVI